MIRRILAMPFLLVVTAIALLCTALAYVGRLFELAMKAIDP